MPPHQASFFSAATNMLKAARIARLSVLERFGRLAHRKALTPTEAVTGLRSTLQLPHELNQIVLFLGSEFEF